MFQLRIVTLLKLTPFLLLANPVSAVGCFSGGLSESAGAVANAISTACDNTLAKSYFGGETISACINLSDGNHVNFDVLLQSGDGSLSASDCIAQNSDTAAGCGGHGGIRQFVRIFGFLNFTLLDPSIYTCSTFES